MVEFTKNVSDRALFFPPFGGVDYCFNFLIVMTCSYFLFHHESILVGYGFPGIYLFLLGYTISSYTIVHSRLLWFFVFLILSTAIPAFFWFPYAWSIFSIPSLSVLHVFTPEMSLLITAYRWVLYFYRHYVFWLANLVYLYLK